MKPSSHRQAPPQGFHPDLAGKGAEALREGRFKDATDLFRQLVRNDSNPEWRRSLNEAYAGRARALAAKEMYKEAAIVLENTIGADGRVAEPSLYLRCLIRAGQSQKAAQRAMKFIGLDLPVPPQERRRLDELTAALSLLHPLQLAASELARPEVAQWTALVAAASRALAAWSAGTSPDEIDALLSKLPLRSAFGPVRLILKSLLVACDDKPKAAKLIEAVGADSAFYPFKLAIEAMLTEDGAAAIIAGKGLSPAARALVLETLGLAASAAHGLSRLMDAEQSGPAALYSFLQKQQDLPRPDLRGACYNLLPYAPDRIPQFEKSFGPLSPFDRRRNAAIAAEARGDRSAAEQAWLGAVEALRASDDPTSKRSLGVVFRHLSQVAKQHLEFDDDGFGDDDPMVYYLERSVEADPDRLSTTLELLDLYREDERTKDVGRLADEAARRFPGESVVLLRAMEAAIARKALKVASGHARRLLELDPINKSARRSMIALGLAQARKQMRSKRPHLALKALVETAKWERPNTPSPEIGIARGLVELADGREETGHGLVREGIALMGGGVVGWLQAAIEAVEMRIEAKRTTFVQQELKEARSQPAAKEAVVAAITALGGSDAAEKRRELAGLFSVLRRWLAQAAKLTWSVDEFHVLANFFQTFGAFDVLTQYVDQAWRRSPGDDTFNFYRIVARTKGDPKRLNMIEEWRIEEITERAASRRDAHFVNRIQRFLEGAQASPKRRKKAARGEQDMSEEIFAGLLDAMFSDIHEPPPVYLERIARKRGVDAAIEDIMGRYRKSPLAAVMSEETAHFAFSELVRKIAQGNKQSFPR